MLKMPKIPKLYKSYWIYALLIPALSVVLDQWSKFWVLDFFKVPQNICEINLRPGLFHEVSAIFDLALVCNPGISYGLLQGDSSIKRWGLTIFAAVMCVVLLYALTRSKDWLNRLSIAFIIGGAIGNGIDRARFGAVTDFISVHDLLPFFPWVFNIADSAISIGVVGLIVASFLYPPEKTSAKSDAA